MRTRTLLGVSALGACALGVSAFTGAWASPPSQLRAMVRQQAKNVTFQAPVTVNNVLRVQKNASIYGHAYAHNGLQVWQGLRINNGGIKTDSLNATGPIQMQSATVSGVLQAGAISGTSLSIGGAASVGGTLTSSGKIIGNGFDGGTGGLTTTGNITAANVNAALITDSGGLTAGPTSLSSLTVTGNVNFSGATVTGLNLPGLNGNNGTVPSLTVGSQNGTSAPLTVSANGHTAQLGVNSAGALTAGDVAASGNLTVSGANGVVTGAIQGIPVAGSSGSGPLSLQGSTISLAGNTTLANGSDLHLSSSTNSASHLVAGTDADVAGTVMIRIGQGQNTSTESTRSVTFTQPYGSLPTVTVTPMADPEPGSSNAPKVWVTVTQGSGNYTGFTIHYLPSATVGAAHDIPFDYHVIG